MGLFGGGNSSSTTNNESQTLTSTAADYSALDGSNAFQNKNDLSLVNSSNNTVQMLDGGAIKQSFDFGNNALSTINDANNATLQALNDSSQRETQLAMAAVNNSQPDAVTSQNLIKYGAIAVVVIVVGIIAFRR